MTATPNPSLKLTRYGMRCKPGLRPLGPSSFRVERHTHNDRW